MSIFAVKRQDGGVTILHTVQQPDGSWPTAQECIAKWPEVERVSVVTIREIAEQDVPNTRMFRDAWADDGATIHIDMNKARTIHLERIRTARDIELTHTDSLMLRAQEQNDQLEIARFKAVRQQLRDIPQTFDLMVAKTPEELEMLWPIGVPRK